MRLIGFITLCLLSPGVAGYAIVVYGLMPLGSVVHPAMRAVCEANKLGIYAHVFGSVIALALGPFPLGPTAHERADITATPAEAVSNGDGQRTDLPV